MILSVLPVFYLWQVRFLVKESQGERWEMLRQRCEFTCVLLVAGEIPGEGDLGAERGVVWCRILRERCHFTCVLLVAGEFPGEGGLMLKQRV